MNDIELIDKPLPTELVDLEKRFDDLLSAAWEYSWGELELIGAFVQALHKVFDQFELETQQERYAEMLILDATQLLKVDKYYEALILVDEAYHLAENLSFEYAQLRALRVYSYIYGNIGMLEDCLKVSLKGLEFLQNNELFKLNEQNTAIEFAFINNIATMYAFQGRNEEALIYYQQALINLGKKDSRRVLALCNICDTYTDIGDLELALGSAQTALETAQSLDLSDYYFSLCNYSFGLVYTKMGQVDEALSYLQKALDFSDRNISKFSQIEPLVAIGRLYVQLGSHNKALEYLLPAIDIGAEISENEQVREAYRLASKCFESLGQYQDAIKYLKTFNTISGKAASVEFEKRLNQYSAELKIEQAKKDAEIFKLRNVELKEMNDAIQLKAKELEEAYSNLAILSQIGHEITAQLDIEKLLTTIYDSVKQLMNTNTFGIGIYDSAVNTLNFKLFIEDSVRVPPFLIELEGKDTYSSKCIQTREVVLNNDLDPDKYLKWPNVASEGESRYPLSLIYYPLILEDQVIGVITVQSYERNAFSSRDVEAIKILASYIGIALNNSQKSEELKRLIAELEVSSTTDPLTGLYNRRYMLGRISDECEKFRRYAKPFSIVIADIDLFKSINDAYGHDCGDYVLKELATLLRSELRKQDDVARWGGEEFFILVTDMHLESTLLMAERIRKKVDEMQFVYQGKSIHVTMTFGISEYYNEPSIEDAFKRADRALYRGKHNGRNQCAVCHPGIEDEDVPI